MKTIIPTIILTILAFICSAESKDNHNYRADGGQLKLYFFYELLHDLGIEVEDGIKTRSKDWSLNELVIPVSQAGGLDLYVPDDGLKGVPTGQLLLEADFSWRSEGDLISFRNLTIQPVKRALKAGELTALEVINEGGDVLFNLDHIHAGFNNNKSMVEFNNMDLRISQWLADKLGKSYLGQMVVGHAHMSNQVSIPTNYVKDQAYILGGCTSGGWPDENNPIDVQLIAMSAQYVRSIGNDHVVFTPSATLKNVADSDVAWWRKFTGVNPPYDNDQHPYLYWSMYREIDNRFEQIGTSGLKHAFFTVNTFCACSGGQILYPTCEDTYSVGNNDSPSHLGPKAEIEAFSGLWQSTGSFFDQVPAGGDGSQDTNSNGTDENRMVVAEADFADTNLDYYISSWYVIRDDIDIYNSMGYRGYQFTPNGNAWITNSTTAFINGPASDQYVTPNTFDLAAGTASQRLLQAGEGHLTVAVKVIDLKDGTYRYNYMVENHDYDPQVQTITLVLADLASFSDFVFADTDELAANDWGFIRDSNELILQAPPENTLDWGELYSFSFTTNAAPQAGQVVLTGSENGGDEFSADVITPLFTDLIFENGFE
ncbi:hypothetical protein OS175_08480 [Marinicella sp. S1101]|uniref:hypothetical protein n=1 Tax=Marinicella marina TaxID=2996016 RepID=UPI002260EE12|nr:hypothetical protein [Marinicella marina]MCX7553913.1 hypothetical protein [Marinicella marina]MDJ1140405.1 hypothetical protein [Marinicella marina]